MHRWSRKTVAKPIPIPNPNRSPNDGRPKRPPHLLPCVIRLVTLRCKLKRGPGLALGPMGAPEYESRLNSRSRVPLSTFSCRFYPFRWWSPAKVHWTVHVDCPRGQIQIHPRALERPPPAGARRSEGGARIAVKRREGVTILAERGLRYSAWPNNNKMIEPGATPLRPYALHGSLFRDVFKCALGALPVRPTHRRRSLRSR
jgi:hypothetical protein